jgi:hypothetical protein
LSKSVMESKFMIEMQNNLDIIWVVYSWKKKPWDSIYVFLFVLSDPKWRGRKIYSMHPIRSQRGVGTCEMGWIWRGD